MNRFVLILPFLLLLTSCAEQTPRIRVTQSGYPETIFAHASLTDVRNRLTGACESRGIEVLDSSDNSVSCGKELQGGDAFIATVVIGNSYSTTPMLKIRFNFYREGEDVKIVAHQWIETQMAFGQIRKADMNNNNQFNSVQHWLDNLSR